MMYACKLDINYNSILIEYEREVKVKNPLTLEILKKHVKENENFYVLPEDEYTDIVTLKISGKRIETEKERLRRIAKLEQYNRNYEKFWGKHKK